MRISTRFLLLLAWMVCAPGAAHAVVICEVSASGVAFGNFDSIANQNRDTSGTISVTCTGTVGDAVSYTIKLSTGAGTYSSRTASSGSSTLAYNLYIDSSRSQVWGDGTSGTSTVSDSYTLAASPTTREYTVYGRIPANQTQAKAGSFTDDIVITLVY